MLREAGIAIAESTYYAHQHRCYGLSARQLDDAYLANWLFDVWDRNFRVYGRRKLWKAAARAGTPLGRDQVERLMKLAGMSGLTRRRRTTTTTVANPAHARPGDHMQRRWAMPKKPDQCWAADFTYVPTRQGFCYVAFVTDIYSRRILGWTVSTSKTTLLVLSALRQALQLRQRTNTRFTSDGLVHHSDAGSQYTSLAFSEALRQANIQGSIGTVGDALDNALMESTIGLYKGELIDRYFRIWPDHYEVERRTAEWIHWYNHTRLHSAIGDIPPVEYEQHSTAHHAKAS